MAAALTMTASIFAADVAAAVQGYGDLFSMEFTEGAKPNVLGWNDPWDREFNWYSTGIGFSFTGDRAGLSFELDNREVTVKKSKFWIQPADMLKITLGDNCIEMSKETIDYAGTVFSNGFEGWDFTLTPVDGLTIDLGLVTAQPGSWSTNYWYGVKNYGAASMGEVTAAVAYAADFGTIKAIYDLNNKANTVAVDFAGTFGGVMVSPSVAFGINAKDLKADLFVTANAAGVGINLYTLVGVPLESASDTSVAVNTKFTYGTAIGQASLQVKDENVLADAFAMMVKANLGFNCGSAGMDVGVQLDVASNIKVSVPFQYNIHF